MRPYHSRHSGSPNDCPRQPERCKDRAPRPIQYRPAPSDLNERGDTPEEATYLVELAPYMQ